MRLRAVAAIALSGALALGLSGCNVIGHAPAATLDQYAPSDGAYVTVGGLSLGNFMIIAEDAELGSLVGTATNNTAEDIDFTIEWNVDGTWHSVDLVATAQGRTMFGFGDGETVHLTPVARPGDILESALIVNGTQTTFNLPVHDTTLGEYEGLLPTPAPVVTETPEPESTEPEPTETPAP